MWVKMKLIQSHLSSIIPRLNKLRNTIGASRILVVSQDPNQEVAMGKLLLLGVKIN